MAKTRFSTMRFLQKNPRVFLVDEPRGVRVNERQLAWALICSNLTPSQCERVWTKARDIANLASKMTAEEERHG